MIILLSDSLRITIVLLLIILVFTALHLKFNKKDEMTIVERFGKFHRLIEDPVIFFLFPFIDRVLERIPVEEIHVSRRFTYEDNHHEQIKMNISITYKVFDPQLYAYASIDAIGSIIDLIKTSMENQIEAKEMDDQIKSYGRDLGLTIINYHFN